MSRHSVSSPCSLLSSVLSARLKIATPLLGSAVILALVWAALVVAAATPISPPHGAVVRSAHPVLTWSLPANEQTEAIYVATRPETTPQGRFYEENIVARDSFFSTEDPRQWAPTEPLGAGQYWWTVESRDRQSFDSRFNAPISFTIPPEARITGLRTSWSVLFGTRELRGEVDWRANTRRVVLVARLFRGRRLIGVERHSESVFSFGSARETSFDFTLPRRVKRGARLVVRVTLVASTVQAQRSKTIRSR